MALFAEAVHKLGLLIRVVLLIVLLVPMFWMMAYPLWISFTPPWFDLLCMVAAGVAAIVMLVVGTLEKRSGHRAEDGVRRMGSGLESEGL